MASLEAHPLAGSQVTIVLRHALAQILETSNKAAQKLAYAYKSSKNLTDKDKQSKSSVQAQNEKIYDAIMQSWTLTLEAYRELFHYIKSTTTKKPDGKDLGAILSPLVDIADAAAKDTKQQAADSGVHLRVNKSHTPTIGVRKRSSEDPEEQKPRKKSKKTTTSTAEMGQPELSTESQAKAAKHTSSKSSRNTAKKAEANETNLRPSEATAIPATVKAVKRRSPTPPTQKSSKKMKLSEPSSATKPTEATTSTAKSPTTPPATTINPVKIEYENIDDIVSARLEAKEEKRRRKAKEKKRKRESADSALESPVVEDTMREVAADAKLPDRPRKRKKVVRDDKHTMSGGLPSEQDPTNDKSKAEYSRRLSLGSVSTTTANGFKDVNGKRASKEEHMIRPTQEGTDTPTPKAFKKLKTKHSEESTVASEKKRRILPHEESVAHVGGEMLRRKRAKLSRD
ncbi:hypothetical protein LTR50_001140 [Elasticomyces elasticus]|nr:hypothetical protein LTR50_001140 [Elasticomyces elasticus]